MAEAAAAARSEAYQAAKAANKSEAEAIKAGNVAYERTSGTEAMMQQNAAAVTHLGEMVEGVVNSLKSLKANTPVGDQVKTPANSPDSFIKLRGGQGFKDKDTGTIFQKSDTNHSKSPGGEFKAGPAPGVPPTSGTKVTVSGGQDGGCVLKRDRC